MTKAEQYREQVVTHLEKTAGQVKKETFGKSLMLTYNNGHPCYMEFYGKAKKPLYNYRFDDEQARDTFIAKRKKRLQIEIDQTERYAQECKERAEKMQKGVILVSVWGYEQTNVDFYIILERKGVTVTLQEIGQDRTYDDDMSGNCTPNIDKKIGEPFKKRVNKHGSISFASYKYAFIWEGNPIGWSSWN